MADNRIGIEIAVSGDAEIQFKKLSNGIQSFEKASVKSIFSFNRAFETFTGVVTGNLVADAFKAMAGAAKDAFTTMIVEGVRAAEEQEDAMNRLNVALAQSGQLLPGVSDDLDEFAAKLQNTTKFSDDAVLNNAALIQSLAHLDKEGLKKATSAAVDLSAALGIDLTAAAQLVGKAATGEVSSFSRYGLIIRKGASDADTFARAMEQINSKFGGAAAGQLNTYSGATTQLVNNFGEVGEALGFTIIQNQTVIEVIKEGSRVFAELTETVKGQDSALKELVGQGLILTIQSLNVMIVTLDTLARIGEATIETLIAPIKVLTAASVASSEALKGNFTAAFDVMKGSIDEVGQSIDDALVGDSKLGAASVAMNRLEEAARRGFGAMQSGADSASSALQNNTAGVEKLTEAQERLLDQGRQLAEENSKVGALKQAELELARAQAEESILLTADLAARENEIINAKYAEQANALRFALQKGEIDKAQFANAEITLEKKKQAELTRVENAGRKQREENLKSSFSTIATLQQSSVGELFRIGQAAALAQGTIDGIAAVQKALTAAPPPFNFVLAALVGTASAVNLGKIASAQPPKLKGGIDSVPGIGTQDNFPAILAPGERVVPAQTNRDLKGFLSESSGMKELLASIDSKLERLNNQIVVNIGSREISNEIRYALESGRTFA